MKKQQAELRLHRTGHFTVRTVPGTPHCGTADFLPIQYEFTALCAAESLDDRGFLFDQLNVKAFFDRQKECRVSCENYAQQLLRELYKLILKENPKCQPLEMTLMLAPSPYDARITVSVDLREKPKKKAA